ncbi:MAG: alpha-E domain-containing protein [Verrucomicrobiales bacterium]|nr:alpha-E domain-containing protein [Verrucomicrobiales bacterium]
MLSRVANSLYWLSRYVERAENLTRLVDVVHDRALETGLSNNAEAWQSALYAICSTETYEEATGIEGEDLDVGRFITFSSSNPDSIRRCFALARENARMVRDQISEEMWLELNSAHLFMKSEQAETLWLQEPGSLYREVVKFCLLFEGLIEGTILHDEGWHFIQVGKFLERADKTSRILDMLTYESETDRAKLISVLRSCSGLAAFRSEFRGDVTLENVFAFLLFSNSFPRSVRFCLRQTDELLHAISGMPGGSFANEAERVTGSVLAQMNFSNVDNVLSIGLHQYIDDLQTQINEIGQRVFETYVLLPSEVQNIAGPENWRLQWQQQQQ